MGRKSPQKIPDFLYRYRPLQTSYAFDEIEQALSSKAVYLSSADSLNDPFDFRPVYLKPSPGEFKKYLGVSNRRNKLMSRQRYQELAGRQISREDFRRLPGNKLSQSQSRKLRSGILQTMIDEFPERTRVSCFSESGDSIPMWAHYTNDHKGICIQYRLSWPASGKHKELVPLRVVYQEKRPELTFDTWGNFTSRRETRVLDEEADAGVMETICLTKSEQWAYEKEWRVFENAEYPPQYRIVECLEVCSIRIGLKVEPEKIQELKDRFGARISLERAKLSEESYSLRFDSLE